MDELLIPPIRAHTCTPQFVVDSSWQVATIPVAPHLEVSEPEPTGNIALEIDPITCMTPSPKSSGPLVGSQPSGELLCGQHESRGRRTISLQEKGPITIEQDTGSAPDIFILPLKGSNTNLSSRPLDATSSNGPNTSHIVPCVREHNLLSPLSASIEGSTTIELSSQSSLDLVQRVGSDDDTFNATYVSSDDNQVQVEYEDQHPTPPQSSSPLAHSSQADLMSSPIQHVGFEANTNESHSMTAETTPPREGVLVSPKPAVQPVIGLFAQETGIENTSATTQVGKRKRCESLLRDEEHSISAPNPKRLTIKSQRMQHEKLKSPFRSPLLSRTEERRVEEPKSIPGRNDAVENSDSVRKFAQKVNNRKEMAESKAVKEAKQSYRTEKAATQFKSPLPLDAVPKLGNMVRMTPNVQVLERKLQALKRAVKIKQQNQEHVLEELAQKWIYAGREVSWELWSLVKDSDTSGKESYRSEWCELGDRKESSNLDPSNPDSLCTETIHEDDDSKHQEAAISEEPVQNSFGMMLRHLSIDPKTLGWEEEEGTFIDD